MSRNMNMYAHRLPIALSVGWRGALGKGTTVLVSCISERLSNVGTSVPIEGEGIGLVSLAEGVCVLILPKYGVGELVGPTTVEDSLVKFTPSLELASGRMSDEELWIVVIFGVVSFTANTRVVPFVMFPIGRGKVLLTDVVLLASSFIIVPFNTVPLMVL